MILRRSKRTPVPKTIWEEKDAPSAASDPKITRKTARTAQETALKPIAIGPLLEAIELDEKALPELPIYTPLLDLHYQPSESLAMSFSELQTFQKLLTSIIIDKIIVATNNYAKNAREDKELLSFTRP